MDDVLTRAGIFQGVEPHAVEILAQALEPAEFARGERGVGEIHGIEDAQVYLHGVELVRPAV